MSESRRGLMAGLLMLVTAIAFEAQAVSTAMPAAADDLGELHLYAWAFTAFMLPQIVAIVLGGRWCDRSGPERPLLVGVAIFAVGIAVSALAWSMPVLLVGRFIQGFGGGLVNLALMVLVGRAFPATETARVMMAFSTAWMLPSFLGPAIAAWLSSTFSWHVVFWAVLPLAGIGLALLVWALTQVELPPLDESDAAPVAVVWALAIAVGAGLIQAAGQHIDWYSLPLAVAGLALVVFTVPRLMPVDWHLAGGGLSATMGVRFLLMGAFFGGQAFLPLMLVHLRGQSLLVAGMVVTIASIGWIGASWFQSRRWLRLSRDQIIILGTVLVTAGFAVVLVGVVVPAVPLALIGAGSFVSGFGMGCAAPSTSMVVMQMSPAEVLGRNTSSLQVCEALGASIIAGAAGTLFAAYAADQALSFIAPFALVTGCAALSIAGAVRIGYVANMASAPQPA